MIIFMNKNYLYMRETIIKYETSSGRIINYMFIKPHEKFQNNAILGHKKRVKEVLFGEIFTYYDEEMNFDHVPINKILIDNR